MNAHNENDTWKTALQSKQVIYLQNYVHCGNAADRWLNYLNLKTISYCIFKNTYVFCNPCTYVSERSDMAYKELLSYT